MSTATVRDLRNRFPKVKEMVEAEGEVIVTDKGQPKYKLTLYTPAQTTKSRRAKDYMARLRRFQPRPISRAAAKSLHDESRGER
ncbi:MAG: type II toxin-antitoxin system Phd/YefM family antitoxin [Acidobacteria bacterium]|nr:type II toxin-antitoxin system Phd/YefM family antitoxin [Acidobacteriota bacterium]